MYAWPRRVRQTTHPRGRVARRCRARSPRCGMGSAIQGLKYKYWARYYRLRCRRRRRGLQTYTRRVERGVAFHARGRVCMYVGRRCASGERVKRRTGDPAGWVNKKNGGAYAAVCGSTARARRCSSPRCMCARVLSARCRASGERTRRRWMRSGTV